MIIRQLGRGSIYGGLSDHYLFMFTINEGNSYTLHKWGRMIVFETDGKKIYES